MKPRVLVFSYLPAAGMAIYPFILVKEENFKKSTVLINHEKIHLKQQLELFIIPFYLLYLINYIINLLRYSNHQEAYQQIIFEKEAYQNDSNPMYLLRRKRFAWLDQLRTV
jgi:hypothetical protein